MKIIHLKEVLEEMGEGKPFSITYVTCDVTRNTGGDIMSLENVILSFKQNGVEKFGFETPAPNVTEHTKRANHYVHASRNVLLQNGMRRKFHLRLLLQFNGQKVFY